MVNPKSDPTVAEPMPDLDLEAFAHVIAHDMGAPIRGISIHLKLLERELGDDPEVKQRIDLLQDRLRRLDTMVRRVREFSKAIVAQQDPGQTRVEGAVRNALDRMEATCQLEVDGDATVAANALVTDMMLGELVRNAIEHHDGEARVTIGITDSDPVVITVEDDGPGIQYVERAMEPFTKSGSFVEAGRGTGLALARLVAQQLGGDLELASPITDGRGTRATLRLPRA